MMLALDVVAEADEAIKPETGSTALGLIDAIVGTADAALLPPDYQLCSSWIERTYQWQHFHFQSAKQKHYRSK